MYASQCEEILFSTDARGIATVTLNRAEALNALTWDMQIELTNIFNYCSYAEEVRVVILTGAGKHFCAGGDIKAMKARIDSGESLPTTGLRYLATAARTIRRCSKPVIARINGSAVGAGAAFTFACDFRVGDIKSKLGAGFTGMAYSGDTNGVYTLSRIIGAPRATEFFMLAQTFNAQESFSLGILNRLAEEGKLEEEVEKLAVKLASSPTRALGFQKKMINMACYPDLELMQEMEESYMPICDRSVDHAEAVSAFLEKRSPQFIGK